MTREKDFLFLEPSREMYGPFEPREYVYMDLRWTYRERLHCSLPLVCIRTKAIKDMVKHHRDKTLASNQTARYLYGIGKNERETNKITKPSEGTFFLPWFTCAHDSLTRNSITCETFFYHMMILPQWRTISCSPCWSARRCCCSSLPTSSGGGNSSTGSSNRDGSWPWPGGCQFRLLLR